MKGWMTKDFFGGQLQCNETQSRLVVDVNDVFVAQCSVPQLFFLCHGPVSQTNVRGLRLPCC